MLIRELLTKIGFDVNEKVLDQVDARLESVKRNLDGINPHLLKFGQGMSRIGQKLTFGVTLPLVAAGGFFIKAASDAEETANKFAVTFDSVSSNAEKVAKDLQKNYGLSRQASKDLLSNTGDLLTGFGFTGKAALDLSEQTNKLAVDLASFTNIQGGAKRASSALTKALLGERESVKELGISILEKDVKDKVTELRSKGITFQSERQAKAVATLKIAYEQSKNALGDYNRTQNSFANRARLSFERLKDISDSFGRLLLPNVNKALEGILKLLNGIEGMNEGQKKLVLSFGSIVAAAGPLLWLFGTLAVSIVRINQLLFLFKTAGFAVGAATAGWVAVIVAAVAALAVWGVNLWKWFNGQQTVLNRTWGTWETFKIRLGDTFKAIGDFFMKWLVNPILSGIDMLSDAFGFVGNFLDKFFDGAAGRWQSFSESVAGGLDKIGRFLGFGGDNINGPAFAAPGVGAVSSGGISNVARTGTVTRSSNQQVQLNVDARIEVPTGDTSTQVEYLEQTADKIFEKRLADTVRHIVTNAPEIN